MTRILTQSSLGLISLGLLLSGAAAAHSQNYAASIVSASLTASAPYNDPSAVLGQPTTLVNGIYDTPKGTYVASMVYPAYNQDPGGKNLLASLGGGTDFVTVKMAAPIIRSDSHWYHDDFIVYGNASFSDAGYDSVTPTTDMSQFIIGDHSPDTIYQNGTPTVSVSADGINFTQLTTTQTFFPENPYAWAGNTASNPSGWGALNDFTRPVDPSLTAVDFIGKSVADADNRLYGGAAGGQAFSLTGTGLSSVQYIRFTGTGNIDAIASVSDNPSAAPVPEASSAVTLGLLFGFGFLVISGRRKAALGTGE